MTAKKPQVREAIRKYEEALLPLADLRLEQEQALSRIKDLAFSAADPRLKLAANAKLFELLEVFRDREERIQSRRAEVAEPVEAIVSELLALAGETRPQIELEAVESDPDGTADGDERQ
jgi:hypothetical protein